MQSFLSRASPCTLQQHWHRPAHIQQNKFSCPTKKCKISKAISVSRNKVSVRFAKITRNDEPEPPPLRGSDSIASSPPPFQILNRDHSSRDPTSPINMASLRDDTIVNKTNSPPNDFNEFEDMRAGVKGLVDSGIDKVPKIFIHQPEVGSEAYRLSPPSLQVPIIDLESIEKDEASYRNIVQQLLEAATSWGVFQLVNHGVQKDVMDEVLKKVKDFHEGDMEVKAKLYSRSLKKKVRFVSNLTHSQEPGGATWHDTFVCSFDEALDATEIPLVCREAIVNYREELLGVVERVYGLVSAALGLPADCIESSEYAKAQVMFSHYYPACPEPELTMGLRMHTDPTFITVVLQDSLGGLQVLHDGYLVDVTPIPGALLVFVGDLLKCLTNDKFRSIPHHVLASKRGPRISVVTLVTPAHDDKKPFGPLKELLSDDNPPLYQDFLMPRYVEAYMSKESNCSSLTQFKI